MSKIDVNNRFKADSLIEEELLNYPDITRQELKRCVAISQELGKNMTTSQCASFISDWNKYTKILKGAYK